jgi:hypothetical protein
MATNDEIEWKNCWKKPVKAQFTYGYAGRLVLLKGIRGEVYPCKIDIFNDTYTTIEPKSEETIRAETAKQIFEELEEIELDSYYLMENEKYEALKKKYKVD